MSEILLELDPVMSLADASEDIGKYIMLSAGQYILWFLSTIYCGEFDFFTDSYGPLRDSEGILVL